MSWRRRVWPRQRRSSAAPPCRVPSRAARDRPGDGRVPSVSARKHKGSYRSQERWYGSASEATKCSKRQQLCGEPPVTEPFERQAAVDRSRLHAPYKQEVACSSQAPPIPRQSRSEAERAVTAHASRHVRTGCGSVVEAWVDVSRSCDSCEVLWILKCAKSWRMRSAVQPPGSTFPRVFKSRWERERTIATAPVSQATLAILVASLLAGLIGVGSLLLRFRLLGSGGT